MMKIMSYNALYRMSLIDIILRDNDARSQFFDKLDLITPSE